jgi:putative transcriptional regulator
MADSRAGHHTWGAAAPHGVGARRQTTATANRYHRRMHTRCRLIIALTLTLSALGQALAQAPERGDLLVSTPELTGSTFAESVLLLIHHDDNGSIGLLLNRPTRLGPADVFPELTEHAALPARLFLGGPVQSTSLLMLVRGTPPTSTGTELRILDDVYVTGDTGVLDAGGVDAADESRIRMYAGQAQWQPGQLEAEIADGSWEVKPGRADVIFSADLAGLWERALKLGSALVVDAAPRNREIGQAR